MIACGLWLVACGLWLVAWVASVRGGDSGCKGRCNENGRAELIGHNLGILAVTGLRRAALGQGQLLAKDTCKTVGLTRRRKERGFFMRAINKKSSGEDHCFLRVDGSYGWT